MTYQKIEISSQTGREAKQGLNFASSFMTIYIELS